MSNRMRRLFNVDATAWLVRRLRTDLDATTGNDAALRLAMEQLIVDVQTDLNENIDDATHQVPTAA